MKVAIEFYGHLRSFRETADNIIENFIKPVADDVDVFIHCWDETDHSDLTWHNMDCEKRGRKVTDEDIKFLEEKYNPKKILCEKQISVDNDKEYLMKGSNRNISYRVLKNTYYTRYRVSKLRQDYQKEAGKNYDYVIQARLDLIFNKKADFLSVFPLEKFFPDIENTIFYAWTHDSYYFNFPTCGRGGTDILYFGKPEAMNKLSNLYEHLDEIDLDKYLYSCDYLLLHNAIRQNMLIVPFNFYVHEDFTILRTEQVKEYLEKKNSKPKTQPKLKNKKIIKDCLKLVLYCLMLVLSNLPVANTVFKSEKYYKKIQKYYNRIII